MIGTNLVFSQIKFYKEPITLLSLFFFFKTTNMFTFILPEKSKEMAYPF